MQVGHKSFFFFFTVEKNILKSNIVGLNSENKMCKPKNVLELIVVMVDVCYY